MRITTPFLFSCLVCHLTIFTAATLSIGIVKTVYPRHLFMGVVLTMAFFAKNDTFFKFGVAPFFSPRPNSMRYFGFWINVMNNKFFRASAPSAGFSCKIIGAPFGDPFSIKFSLKFLCFHWHVCIPVN